MLKEQFGECSTTVIEKDTSKVKPVCGHGPNTGCGHYVENDACAFSQHLKDSHYMFFGNSGWLDSSSNLSSASEAEKIGGKFKEVINTSSSNV